MRWATFGDGCRASALIEIATIIITQNVFPIMRSSLVQETWEFSCEAFSFRRIEHRELNFAEPQIEKTLLQTSTHDVLSRLF